MGGLTGQLRRSPPPMSVADQLYCICYDEHRDWYRLGDQVLRLGLAGALLAELVMGRVVTVRKERIVVIWASVHPPRDALLHTLLELIRSSRDVTTLQDWLRVLSDKSFEDVVERLHRFGHVATVEVRRKLRTNLVYRPVNLEDAAWPESRIALSVNRGGEMWAADWVLAGLVVALGLDIHVFFDPRADVETVREMTELLPPEMRDLLAEVEAAAGGTATQPT